MCAVSTVHLTVPLVALLSTLLEKNAVSWFVVVFLEMSISNLVPLPWFPVKFRFTPFVVFAQEVVTVAPSL